MSRRWVSLAGLVLLSALLMWGISHTLSAQAFATSIEETRELMSRNQFPEALELLKAVPSRFRNDPEVLYRKGVCEHAGGDLTGAVSTWSMIGYETEWGVRGGLARARTLVGDQGRFSEGEEVFLEILRESKEPGKLRDEVRRTLAELYFWQGRREDVRDVLEEGWKNTTDPIGELRDHWRAESSPTLIEKVRSEIDHAFELAPEDDRVWLAKGNLALQLGNHEEAATWFDRCLKKRPNDPILWRARLERARTIDDLNEAIRALGFIPASRFTLEERLATKAWLAFRLGEKNAEKTTLEELIKLVPGEIRAFDRLAALASEAGESEKSRAYRLKKAELDAAKDRYRALLDDKLEPALFAELATLAEQLGRRFEARGWWVLRAAYAPSDPVARAAVNRFRHEPEPERLDPNLTLAKLFHDLEPKSQSDVKTISLANIPKFRDDAAAAGLKFVYDNGRSPSRQIPETTGGGVGLIDYDRDGWMDVYLVQGGAFPADPARPYTGDRLFRNKRDGTFEDVTEKSKIGAMLKGYGHGVTVGDIDNDGYSDIFVTRWRGYALYRNLGDGTFEDVTERYGLGGDRDWPTSAAFADLDNDGDLDLYVAHYLAWDENHPTLCPRVTTSKAEELSDPGQKYNYCTPRPFTALADHLFRNDGGRFVDVTEAAGIVDKNGRGLGVVAADIDDDGLVDLFVANDTTANYLWHNLGGFKFEEIGVSRGVACNADGAFQAGMGVACGDLNGDGRPDLFVTNFYGESTTYFQNLGGGVFSDMSAAIGLASPTRYLLGFGIVLFDSNNDGNLDVAIANGHVNDDRPDYPYDMPATLLTGSERGFLTDVTQAAGAPWTTPRVARGLAAGDINNDGHVDILILSQQSPLGFFHNLTESPSSHFVRIQLEGTKSNRDGVGASVELKAGGKTHKAWRVGGGSFQSASDGRLHIGLGSETEIESVEVHWLGGTHEKFTGLSADKAWRLKEGQGVAVPLVEASQ